MQLLCDVSPLNWDDEEVSFDILESGDIDFKSSLSLSQTAAYVQFKEICDAAFRGQLEADAFESLMLEVENYLRQEIRRFQALPDFDFDLYTVGREHILNGLALLSEACLVAHYCEHTDGLHSALSMANSGNAEIVRGRQVLDRAEAVLS